MLFVLQKLLFIQSPHFNACMFCDKIITYVENPSRHCMVSLDPVVKALLSLTWAVRCIPVCYRRQKRRIPVQTKPCKSWTCYHSRSSWGTDPALRTCSYLESSSRQRRYSYGKPKEPKDRDVNMTFVCGAVFTCCFIKGLVIYFHMSETGIQMWCFWYCEL